MSQSKNPFFHSQSRRKSESAAVPLRDRNVKRNTAISYTVRNVFAPPVPPKDEPPRIASAVPTTTRMNSTLGALEKDWMLNDCIGSMPTPVSQGGLAQVYLPESIHTVNVSESQERKPPARQIHTSLRATRAQLRSLKELPKGFQHSAADVVGTALSSDGTLLETANSGKTRATKRDTIADLLSDILGSDELPLSHQEALNKVATLSAMPPPLRIPKKFRTSPRSSSVPPTSKFNKLQLSGRPSLQITTTFTDPRPAPIPLVHRRGFTQHIGRAHCWKDRPAHKSILKWTRPFSRNVRKFHSRSNMASPSLTSRNDIKGAEESARQLFLQQRRAHIFPEQKNFHRLQNDLDTSPAPTPPQRRNTQRITVNRMRDPDEAFDEVLALRKRATAYTNEDTTTVPRPNNKEIESDAKGGCLGFYASAKTHTEDIVESIRSVRRKNEAKRRREKMMEEVRRKYEEMLNASTITSTDKGKKMYEYI